MRQFAEAFLLVFAQLAVGGVVALSIPPFQQLERGFYKSTAAIYLGAALVAIMGWSYILLTRDLPAKELPYRVAELAVWTGFTASLGAYVYSLWGDPYRLRARSYLTALLLGLAALIASAMRYGSTAAATILLYPIDFVASALILGSAATGMLLGHWYLIDVGLTLTPFRRMHRFFVRSIHFEVLAFLLSGGILWLVAGPALQSAFRTLWEEHALLFSLRIALGPLTAYVLAWMIGRTLAIPQTMAATGLFYIAVLAVTVGEILGRTILFRTALPL